jgi:hypothetical protein
VPIDFEEELKLLEEQIAKQGGMVKEFKLVHSRIQEFLAVVL